MYNNRIAKINIQIITVVKHTNQTIMKLSIPIWGYFGLTIGLLVTIFYSGLINMVGKWENDEYSHAYILPFVIGYYLWQNKTILERAPVSSGITGTTILIAGIFLYFSGELSSLFILMQYGFLISISGIFIIVYGPKAIIISWPAFILLFFMIPLPNFFQNNLSAELQLISSNIGVGFIRLFGISVFLEGNVIDLGKMKLQVVDACSGLRYLFPLVSLSFIAALFYHTSTWKRIIVFLSAIPITVFMNSLRIGIIGITVEYFGSKAAEGFIHDFEGWIIFMACAGLLVIEMWLFTKIGQDRRPLSVVFNIEQNNLPIQTNAEIETRKISASMIVSIVILIATLLLSFSLSTRTELIPERKLYTNFPLEIGQWKGVSSSIKPLLLEELKLTDYIMVNFRNTSGDRVNFYSAYYGSQRAGESAHSPRTCIPGGGWRIKEINQITINTVKVNEQPLTVNRTLVQYGPNRQLVYYWFQQRGRVITNEYLVKWYLFLDSLTKNRTDGALVRLTIPLPQGKPDNYGNIVLQKFISNIMPKLPDYIPN